MAYLFFLYFAITNLDSHQVQLLALRGGDGAFLVVVFPRSEQQQSPFCAGVKLLALWFCQRRKAILNKYDGGKPCIEGCSHDQLLARRYGRRDEHSSLSCHIEITGFFHFYLIAV